MAVGGLPVALETAVGGVAVAVSAAPTTHRGGTLASSFGPIASLDPGACCVVPPEIPGVLYDGLTGLDRLSPGAH